VTVGSGPPHSTILRGMRIQAAVLREFRAGPLRKHIEGVASAEPKAGEVLVPLVALRVCHTLSTRVGWADPSGVRPPPTLLGP